ncbi:hypothetical protein G9A89_011927 [Geosiphon pyriformis]|nr:hypothetical protein G9A89_011927 [Geosiphon pyriformis]
MDLKTASSSDMSKKKVPKGAFYGPAGDSFAQKKKVVLENVKHSGDEKDISLSKSGSGDSVYSDVDSISGDDEDVGMSGISEKSPLGSAATTPKAKHVNTGTMFGSSLGSPNFVMNDDEIVLPSCLSISLEKKWINPKIIKTPVEVSIKKSFALDIDLLAVEGNSATAKTRLIRKIFSSVNGFGGATTSSKFEGIIRFTFTSEESMKKTASLAREKEIIVNTDLMKSGVQIPMDTLKEIIVTVVAEFGEIKLIKIQLIGMWQKAVVKFAKLSQADQLASRWSFLIGKDSMRVAKAMGDHNIWAFRDRFRALLFTLPVRTTVHDLSNLLDRAGGKTCIINCSLNTGNRIHCAMVGFKSENDLNSAFLTEPVFGGVRLLWARFDCDASNVLSLVPLSSFKKPASGANCLQLAKLYARKNVPISPQVVSFAPFSGGSSSGSGFDSSVFFLGVPGLDGGGFLLPNDNYSLSARLASLEHSLGLLHDQISHIVCKLSGMNLVPLAPPPFSSGVLAVPVTADINMILDAIPTIPVVTSLLPSVGSNLGSSSSKVLTSKMGSLESKLAALNTSVGTILGKFDQLCASSGSQIRSWIVNKFNGVWVFISGMESGYLGADVVIVMNFSLGNKLSVLILGLYTGASSVAQFSQAGNINSLIAKAVNESSFIIFGGNFNEDSSRKCASFRKCLDMGLVNALDKNSYGKLPIWSNSRGIAKTIDYVLISSNLVNAVVDCDVVSVREYFDTDHQAVSVWKYNCKGADDIKWAKFEKDTAANAAMFYDNFLAARICSDLDSIKESSKFYRLELLVSKLVKASRLNSAEEFTSLLDRWEGVDSVNASMVRSLFLSGSHFDAIQSVLSKVKKSYRSSKMFEAEMESFELDKGHIIRSVLERPFRKITLDHLIVDDELVLEPDLVKAKVDAVMEGWTRKRSVFSDVTGVWSHQYQPLEYVFDNAFSGVMCPIDFDEMSSVISSLPDGKAAGLSVLLNICLEHESVPGPWKEAWVSMIPKPYEWEGVLTNTCPIALIEMAHKVFSKVLLDRISSAYSVFDVLRGDNFSVLKGITTQSPIFAIGSVIEDALEKNQELWLVLQDIIHNDQVKRVMTDFGLTNEYQVHDGLDQGEVFSPLLWHIFYDPLLCEVKRQESVCGYRLDSHFVANTGHTESRAGLTSFLTASAFIDDTI